jgi:hypothetical protein
MNLPIGTYSAFALFEKNIDRAIDELGAQPHGRFGYSLLVRPLLPLDVCEYLKRWGPGSDTLHDKARMLNVLITGHVHAADPDLVSWDYLTRSPSIPDMYLWYKLAKTRQQKRRRLLLLLQIAAENKSLDDLWWMIHTSFRCLQWELMYLYTEWAKSETKVAQERTHEGRAAFLRLHQFMYGDYDVVNSEWDELCQFIVVSMPADFAKAACEHMRRPGSAELGLSFNPALAKQVLEDVSQKKSISFYGLKILLCYLRGELRSAKGNARKRLQKLHDKYEGYLQEMEVAMGITYVY